MLIVGFLSWWYGNGWRRRLSVLGEYLARVYDYFSIDLLVKTWFAPFRMNGTDRRGNSLGDKFRAMGDRLVSRIIGGLLRTFMIIFGLISLVLVSVFGLLGVLLWLAVPIFPVAGLVMFAIGWVPNVGL